ncbi:MAG: hypothetical protein N3I35_02425 [Clostridia bacterium]|nr:hypothetical protein [Clostridia bacterium]
MKFRMFMSAIFKPRNLGLLLLFAGISAALVAVLDVGVLQSLIPFELNTSTAITYVPAIFLYLVFVGQTLLNKDFHEKFNRKEKIRNIQDLNFSCSRLANEAKKHVSSTYLQKLRKVMEDKTDIVNSFFKGEHSFIKERIVEQTLNLVQAYIKLSVNFCKRSRELSEMDVGDIANRINANMRKLNFASDPHIVQDIKNLIEMDERIINRLKEEKKDIERIAAKLDYMESTVNMFRHQIMSSIETAEMVEKLETAVNEATALDNVLEERRRNKINL